MGYLVKETEKVTIKNNYLKSLARNGGMSVGNSNKNHINQVRTMTMKKSNHQKGRQGNLVTSNGKE
jgi:hypothetical protein